MPINKKYIIKIENLKSMILRCEQVKQGGFLKMRSDDRNKRDRVHKIFSN